MRMGGILSPCTESTPDGARRWKNIMTPLSDEPANANGAQKGCGYGVFLDVVLSDVEMAA